MRRARTHANGEQRQSTRASILLAAALAAGAVSSCSETKIECSTNADCGASMTCQAGACAAAAAECAHHSDCVAKLGEHNVCRPSDHTCVSLLSTDCVKVFGDDKSDDAAIFGMMLNLGGRGPDTQATFELAFAEFTDQLGGAPGAAGAKARPLALVECDQRADPIRTAKYLAETIQVPAILGPSSSGVVINVAQQVTIPAGVLIMPPGASSALITDLPQKNGLIVRTAASDKLQGKVVALVVGEVEALLKAGPNPPAAIKVGVVAKGDAYGTGLSDALNTSLAFNGKSVVQNSDDYNYRLFQYANTDQVANFDFSSVTSEILAFAPDIIVLAGTFELRNVVAGLESLWPTGTTHPQYVGADGVIQRDFFAEIEKHPDELLTRFRGTFNGNPTLPAFQKYRVHFQAAFPTLNPDNVANGYDGAYALLYSAVALNGQPLTGKGLSDGILKKLVPPGLALDVGPEGLPQGAATLQAGNALDLKGASGPLDFDENGDVTADFQVLCLTRNASSNVVSQPSGEIYDAASGKLVGAFTPCK